MNTCIQGSDGGNSAVLAFIISQNTAGTTSSPTTSTSTEDFETSSSDSSQQTGTSGSSNTNEITYTTYLDIGCNNEFYSLSGTVGECATNPYTNYSGIITIDENNVNDTYWLSDDCTGMESLLLFC